MNVYTFDGTLYNGNVEKDFYTFCLGRNKKLLKFRTLQCLSYLKYIAGLISKTEYHEIFNSYLKDVENVDKEVEAFWETAEKKLIDWTQDWRLEDDVLISASPEFLLTAFAEKNNYTLYATKVDKNTGKIDGEVIYGEEKVTFFRDVFGNKPIIRFFGGSKADAHIAKIADRAYVIKNGRPAMWSNLKGKPKINKKAYKKVCEFEEAAFYRKFLPFVKGSPETYPTYSERLTEQYDRANIVVFSDSHADGKLGLQNVKDTVDFANNAPIKYDAVVNLGDIITPFGKQEKPFAYKKAEKVFALAKKSNRPFIFTKGNHDLNDWDNYPERVLTSEDWGNLFYNYAEKEYGIVRQTKQNGEKSTWHYYDIVDKKIRIIAVDMQDSDKNVLNDRGTCRLHGGNSWYVSNEQMNWISDVALNFDDKAEKDWGVVIVHHQYSNPRFHQSAADVLLDLCVAFNEQSTYSHSYKNPELSFFDMEVNADFTRYANEEQKPHIICWLLGHDHERKNEVKKGINIIWMIHGCCTSVSSDPRLARVLGTCTQNAFDVVNIDTRHRKIRIFAYGATTTCYGESGDRFLPDGLSY